MALGGGLRGGHVHQVVELDDADAAEHPDVVDPGQLGVVNALVGVGDLLVIEGSAGAGKTTTLAHAHELLDSLGQRLRVVTPTHKAAEVASAEIGAQARTASALHS